MKVRVNRPAVNIVVSQTQTETIGNHFRLMALDVGMITKDLAKRLTTYAVFFDCFDDADYCFFSIDKSVQMLGMKLNHKERTLKRLPIMHKDEVHDYMVKRYKH